MPPATRESMSPRPDFTALFPVRECGCGREDCEICVGWQLTPRTADVLHAALEIMADQAFDDIEEHASEAGGRGEGGGVRAAGACAEMGERAREPVESEDGGDWLFFDRLPRITWNQDSGWRRQVARAGEDLGNDLVWGDWPRPREHAAE